MKKEKIAGHLTAAIVASLVIAAAAGSQHVPLTDQQITAQIEHRLVEEGIRDVSEVVDGVATLTGYVTMPYKPQAMTKLASRIAGVQGVADKIDVLPVSGSDDSIRYAIAIRIYDDPLFWNYAIQVDPPIHVIVQHGRVTLTGVVLSELERRKAEVIARSVFGVFNVENKLRLELSEK